MTIKGYPHYVKQNRMLVYGEGGVELAVEYMASHLQTQIIQKGQASKLPHPFNLLMPK